MFSKETYSARRKKLAETVSGGLILLPGNEESPMNYTDNTYHFRQDSTFLYYFGINQASLAGVIDVDSGETMLFGDDYSVEMIVWTGVVPSIASLGESIGVTNVKPFSALQAVVSQAVSSNRAIHFLNPYRSDILIRLAELLQYNYQTIPGKASLELAKVVIAQREVKSAEEIAEIDKAVDITVEMHLAGMRYARPGMRESEVAAKVAEVALAANGNPSFPIIATINGQTLHNHYHGNIIKSGDLFLLDAGAETETSYAGDLSSTFPVDPKFTPIQKEIYRLSLDAHMSSIAMLKPGTAFKDVHLTACRTIFEGLKAFGLTKGDTEEAVKAGAHALFFPCGTGHMMGLDIHDMENLGEQWVGYDGVPKSTQFGLKSLRLGKELRPGYVLTIEPGIYFIPDLMDLWKSAYHLGQFLNYTEIEKFRNFGGLRNEEDFLITEEGARRLGKALPLTIEGVEAVRSQ
ncbi:MAG: aminopeptidase P family protein [Bacteroidales bacterium]|nr:aminopeptidase P family protein [Bacteroidales bacterium]